MMKRKVSNPLTVIAIFAGLSEVFATGTLIALPLEAQMKFIYFVMGFPMLLVVLFFYTLQKDHTVLYAPSDFQDESMYLALAGLGDDIKKEIVSEIGIGNECEDEEQQRLSADKIKEVSIKIDSIVERAAIKNRSEQILDVLTSGSMSSTEISRSTGIHPNYTLRLLRDLKSQGLVKSNGDKKYVKWELVTNV